LIIFVTSRKMVGQGHAELVTDRVASYNLYYNKIQIVILNMYFLGQNIHLHNYK
jgi:hypothetical protein